MLKLSERSDHAGMGSKNRSVMLISKYHHCPEKSINYTYINSSQTLKHIPCQSAVYIHIITKLWHFNNQVSMCIYTENL
jgi:hypothetical protein